MSKKSTKNQQQKQEELSSKSGSLDNEQVGGATRKRQKVEEQQQQQQQQQAIGGASQRAHSGQSEEGEDMIGCGPVGKELRVDTLRLAKSGHSQQALLEEECAAEENRLRCGEQATENPVICGQGGQARESSAIDQDGLLSTRAKSSGGRQQQQIEANICAACCKPIRERYLLQALDKQWHEDCLKCACCDCRLGEVGSSLFTHSNKILCRRDFLRIFGRQGSCAACKRTIPPYELVMRANNNAYHLDCFSCQNCQYRFCVGDRFHLTPKHKQVICILCHSETKQRQLDSANADQQPSLVGPQSRPAVAEL